MSSEHALAALAELAGIIPRYHDISGGEHVTSPETQRALLIANGIAAENEEAVRTSLSELRAEAETRWFPDEVILETGHATHFEFGLGATWTLCEDGDDNPVATGEPADAISLPALPTGVYVLTAHVADRVEIIRVLVAPARLPSIDARIGTSRVWGINLPLYGLQSKRNIGLGDYADLAQFCAVAAKQGAAYVGVNPIHAIGAASPAISPYSPSHRAFLNTAHIAPDRIPGLQACDAAQEIIAGQAQAIQAVRETQDVAYGAHKTVQSTLLEALYGLFDDHAIEEARAQFDAFVAKGGTELRTFAVYESLSEDHGSDWRHWTGADVETASSDRIRFHSWLQWVADHQLAEAAACAKASGMALGLYLDLAVGPRRDGAESWCEQDTIAQAVSVGAPPDHLSPEGQNWDLAGFAPRKLQQQNYRPLRRILASVMRHAGVVRIDHVLGLNRSFWIPDDDSPGAYIRQPFEALLAIIKIEAERHNCTVIGEDLGLVPDGFRETMRAHGVYGYSVLQFEKSEDGGFHDPARNGTQILSCFATHDTPTAKGFESGRDIHHWHRLGWINEEQAQAWDAARARDVAGLMHMSPDLHSFSDAVHAILANSSADIVSIQLDDILGQIEAQNLPGTIDEHPNWRRKYRIDIDEINQLVGMHSVKKLMAQARPQ